MRDGRPVLDADMHVQEPGAAWVDHLDPALRDRVVAGSDPMPVVDGSRPVEIPPNPRREMRPLALVDRFGDLARRGFDPPSTLAGMDAEGVDVAVLFPSFGLYVPWSDRHDPPLAVGLARSYNRWIVEFCAEGRGRLVPVALTPLHDADRAAAEAARAVGDGARAVMVRPNPVHGRVVSHPDHDRFFSALEDLDVPMILHEGTGAVVAATGADRFDSWYGRHAASHPIEQMLAFEALVLDGVLERHPRLRVGLFESGSGWLPWWLHRLDEHHEFLGDPARSRPSELFARQCVISTESDDAFAAATVAAVGADHVVWASDFPHPECAWPHALDRFTGPGGAGLADAERDAVLWGTPCRLFRLDPSTLPRGPEPRGAAVLPAG